MNIAPYFFYPRIYRITDIIENVRKNIYVLIYTIQSTYANYGDNS